MDSQHRHELEQNDLASALSDIKGFWAKWGTIIMLVIAIVAVTVMLINLTRTWRLNAVEGAWGDLAGATSPDVLEAVAADHSDVAVQAIARLDAADLLRVEAGSATDATSGQEKRDRAAKLYEQVLADAAHPVFAMNALQGLATLAETREDWESARTYYDQISATAGDRYPAWKQLAESRVGFLSMLKTAVTFAPEPAPAPTTGSATDAGSIVPQTTGLLEATQLQSLMGNTTGTLESTTTAVPAEPAQTPAEPTPAAQP